MSTFRTGTTAYQLEVPSRFVHEGMGEGKPLLLLTHGFADTGASFLRRALPGLDPRFEILAPNGPFPLPKRVDDEWKEAYGWYFADLNANKVHVHPSVAAGAVASLVRELELEARPKVLVGFSQGGYFLPHLARELTGIRRFIAIGAGFHPRYFKEFGLEAPVDAIHGTADEVIPFAEAQSEFRQLPHRGEFHAISGMTHTINDEGRETLRRLLDDVSV